MFARNKTSDFLRVPTGIHQTTLSALGFCARYTFRHCVYERTVKPRQNPLRKTPSQTTHFTTHIAASKFVGGYITYNLTHDVSMLAR